MAHHLTTRCQYSFWHYNAMISLLTPFYMRVRIRVSKWSPEGKISASSFKPLMLTYIWRRSWQTDRQNLKTLQQGSEQYCPMPYWTYRLSDRLPSAYWTFEVISAYLSTCSHFQILSLLSCLWIFWDWRLSRLTVSFFMFITLLQCKASTATPLIVALIATFVRASMFFILFFFACYA